MKPGWVKPGCYFAHFDFKLKNGPLFKWSEIIFLGLRASSVTAVTKPLFGVIFCLLIINVLYKKGIFGCHHTRERLYRSVLCWGTRQVHASALNYIS